MKTKEPDLLETQSDDEYFQYEKRERYYSAMVKDIVKDNRSLKSLKWVFCLTICAVFSFVCIFGILSIYVLSLKENPSYEDIGIAIAGFGSIISSVIVLPKIIAKHLFPQNSEETRFNFIKDTQKFDIISVYDKEAELPANIKSKN